MLILRFARTTDRNGNNLQIVINPVDCSYYTGYHLFTTTPSTPRFSPSNFRKLLSQLDSNGYVRTPAPSPAHSV